MTIDGGCLCGACRYSSSGAPLNIRACHCHRCQKAIGASFNARVLVALDSTTITGPVAWYSSSPEVRRGFCSNCGTTMFSERAGPGWIGLTMGSLDDPDAFAPTEHIFMASKQAWLCLDDDLPKFAEGPTP